MQWEVLQLTPLFEGHPTTLRWHRESNALQLAPLCEEHLLSWSDRACRSYYNSRPLREGHLAFVDIIFCLPLYCNSRPYASDISFICQHLLLQLPPLREGHRKQRGRRFLSCHITTRTLPRWASCGTKWGLLVARDYNSRSSVRDIGRVHCDRRYSG